jgi:RimJ/RimL family protein N-acetyltransferase
MIDISKLSKRYSVRILEESDVETLARICKQNTVFYEYTEARPTKENILNDMKATPPGITMDDKYYFGFFDDRELIAIMDLIDGYPKAEIAYIGFFMMNPQYQGKQTGTAIIAEVIDCLQSTGKTSVRLAIDKGNPQSTHFWKKNGFEIISEADVNGWTKLVAEKSLIT